VSNREFVVNARDAARNADLLERLNRGEAPSGPGKVVNITVNNHYPKPEKPSETLDKARAIEMALSE
jgi:hypothetical protein